MTTMKSIIDTDDMRDVLKHGRTMRTPMFAMDSMQHDVARHFGDTRLSDAELALRRPGFRYSDSTTADAKQAIRDAHDTYERDLTNAWRGRQRDTGEGAVAGHIHNNDQPSSRTDAMTIDELYAEYSRTVENAWRKP